MFLDLHSHLSYYPEETRPHFRWPEKIVGDDEGTVGGAAQGSIKTCPESDQWSPHHESSRPEEDRRGSAQTVGSREEGKGGVVMRVSVPPGRHSLPLSLFVAHAASWKITPSVNLTPERTRLTPCRTLTR
jgi:hypothetical protein